MSHEARMRIPIWVFAMVIGLGVADVALTLHGQSSAYWKGDYASATEANPIARIFVRWHPLAFAGMAAVYLGAVVVAVRWLSPGPACWLALLVMSGHSIGVAAWLLRIDPLGPWMAGGFLAMIAPALIAMRRLCAARGA